MPTIRELITEKSNLLRNVDQLGPDKASEELVALSSLLSSLNKEIVEAQYWYNIKRQELLKEHGTAAKAKIYAEASEEWKQWQDRVQQKDAIVELIRAIKYYLTNAKEEYMHTR